MDRPAYLPARGRGRGRGSRGGQAQSAWSGGPPPNQHQSNQHQSNQQQSNHRKTSPKKNTNRQVQDYNVPAVSAEERFQDAANRHQEQAQKHLQSEPSPSASPTDDPYISSDEEEDLNDEGIMDGLLKSFKSSLSSGGSGDDNELGSTQEYLMNSLKSKANVCLICIETIKKADPIWSCKGCYCMFHIPCIQKWVKDGVYQQTALSGDNFPARDLPWFCPKCRHEYSQLECPSRYFCFCGKEEEPTFDPWLVPHSCGTMCGKKLKPECGHSCLLLCHPGPCPSCPQTVRVGCHCGRAPVRTRRCGLRGAWSCGDPCRRSLGCGHVCELPCHPDPCPPCPHTASQACACGAQTMLRPCAQASWHCDKVCRRPLSCGNHLCEKVCHEGACGECPRAGKRLCPCGKSEFEIPCTEDVATCMDTCGKLLECGQHQCIQRCHTGPCGTCRELTVKQCRCGKKSKEVQCYKEYLCDIKCMNIRDCTRHNCKRKCCDGACPPCELPCGKPLTCKNHKCASRCHRGRCYPCTHTVALSCRCEGTTITLPCGREKLSKPPKCNLKCKQAAECHHPTRSEHRCHFGRCPPCRLPCRKTMPCGHVCPQNCHSAVLTKLQQKVERVGPWEAQAPVTEELVDQPCPPCQVPIAVTCPGQHETVTVPCWDSAVKSCHRKCGRLLPCGNHTCSYECHDVPDATGPNVAGSTCAPCEEPCTRPRPEGCKHGCTGGGGCHADDCPPCPLMVRMRCHCALVLRHVECDAWTHADDTERDRLRSCGSRCPKNLSCGHQCIALCHPGACPAADQCTERVKVRCACRRRKRDFLCNAAAEANVECDDVCLNAVAAKKKEKEEQEKAKKEEEERKQQQELEEFNRKMKGRKRKPRKVRVEEEEQTFIQKYGMLIIGPILVVIFAVFLYYLFVTQ